MSEQRGLFGAIPGRIPGEIPGAPSSRGALQKNKPPSASSKTSRAEGGAAKNSEPDRVFTSAASGFSRSSGEADGGSILGRIPGSIPGAGEAHQGGAEAHHGGSVGPGLPEGWRRVGACLYLPGGVTVARRTAYDGRWQALRWAEGGAELVCEGASEEAVLGAVADLRRHG